MLILLWRVKADPVFFFTENLRSIKLFTVTIGLNTDSNALALSSINIGSQRSKSQQEKDLHRSDNKQKNKLTTIFDAAKKFPEMKSQIYKQSRCKR
jgi:hypothetical protein